MCTRCDKLIDKPSLTVGQQTTVTALPLVLQLAGGRTATEAAAAATANAAELDSSDPASKQLDSIRELQRSIAERAYLQFNVHIAYHSLTYSSDPRIS